jgi:polyhydroxyalkanoate synthesis regulator phasin
MNLFVPARGPKVVEPTNELIFETLKALRREMTARFDVLADQMVAMQQQLTLLTASRNDIAAAQATHGEISAVHDEVDRLRRQVLDLEVRVKVLEPES